MNNTIMKGIIIILLLALIRISFQYMEVKSMLIQYQKTCAEMQEICAEMQEINDGLITLNKELIQELEAFNDIIKEESKDACNGTES